MEPARPAKYCTTLTNVADGTDISSKKAYNGCRLKRKNVVGIRGLKDGTDGTDDQTVTVGSVTAPPSNCILNQ